MGVMHGTRCSAKRPKAGDFTQRVGSNIYVPCPSTENTPMQVLVDADACPVVVKDILYRAAQRVEVQVTLVANKYMRTPPSRYIKALQVPAGFDAADDRIVELASRGDLVITADIPLAASALGKGAYVLDPRGSWFSSENIQERLTMREVMDQLRGSGVNTGGPAPYTSQDGKAFAAQLDRFLSRHAPPGTLARGEMQ